MIYINFFLILLFAVPSCAKALSGYTTSTRLTTIQKQSDGSLVYEIPKNSTQLSFLKFQNISFEPSLIEVQAFEKNEWKKTNLQPLFVEKKEVNIAPFNGLNVVSWILNPKIIELKLPLRIICHNTKNKSNFFNQVIMIEDLAALSYKEFVVEEVGQFGSSLKKRHYDLEKAIQKEKSLKDPALSSIEELSWDNIAQEALPLDFQKILLAGPQDLQDANPKKYLENPSPGFVYQNGHWFTTVHNPNMPRIQFNEDRWFSPAYLKENKILIPAPLSAKTRFFKTKNNVFVPQFQLSWSWTFGALTQTISSQNWNGNQPEDLRDANPTKSYVVATFKSFTPNHQFILGLGKRPSAHFWEVEKRATATPVPFFSLEENYKQKDDFTIVDEKDYIVLQSNTKLELQKVSFLESIIKFFPKPNTEIVVVTPQFLTKKVVAMDLQKKQQEFEKSWEEKLAGDVKIQLPSQDWMARLHIWLSQILSISRTKDKLNYGAYFYNMYFGIEEGWPIVALAMLGHGTEAQKQAEIMLSDKNLDKKNLHHQYRNGLSSWYAAEVSKLTNDKGWVKKIAPILLNSATWTIEERKKGPRSLMTIGLLPKHTYGGDVSQPAFSLYSNATCWKGLNDTAEIFDLFKVYPEKVSWLKNESITYKAVLQELVEKTLNHSIDPPFLPLALEIGNPQDPDFLSQEKPYPVLTSTFLGNYWNLFAPLLLHTGFLNKNSFLITDYLEHHGGLWGGLSRFQRGLDAVYTTGYVHELLEQTHGDLRKRTKALNALQSFFLHAASQNGFTIPEVAPLFNVRFDYSKYNTLVRQTPWHFGLYDGDSYLDGNIPITEPLSAGAGEGLWLMRKALIDELKNETAQATGELFILPAIPKEWLKEGKEIVFENLPTYYGPINFSLHSFLESKKEVVISFSLKSPGLYDLQKIYIRLVNPYGLKPIFNLKDSNTIKLDFGSTQDINAIIKFH